jgi:hypothetical protein
VLPYEAEVPKLTIEDDSSSVAQEMTAEASETGPAETPRIWGAGSAGGDDARDESGADAPQPATSIADKNKGHIQRGFISVLLFNDVNMRGKQLSSFEPWRHNSARGNPRQPRTGIT